MLVPKHLVWIEGDELGFALDRVSTTWREDRPRALSPLSGLRSRKTEFPRLTPGATLFCPPKRARAELARLAGLAADPIALMVQAARPGNETRVGND